MKNSIDTDRFYVKKRAPNIKSKTQGSSSQSKHEKIRKEVLLNFSKIIPQIKVKRARRQQKLDINIKEDFSIFTNPFYVLEVIGQFTQRAKQKKVSEVNIDMFEMPMHDLTSQVLIAQAAIALKADKSRRGTLLSINGTYPNDPDFE